MNRLYRLSLFAIAVAGLSLGTPSRAKADPPEVPQQTAPLITIPLTMDGLIQTDRATLEALYRSAGAGSAPLGSFAGRASPEPGTAKGLRQSKRIGWLWKGKEFPGNGTMINRLALGAKAVKADMYYGSSFLDGGPTIVLDYANTSKSFKDVRDEMREVAPGLYLGLTYVRKCPEPKLAQYYVVQKLPECSGVHN